MTEPIAFHPLTPDHWPDLECLIGANGACAGCWCMYYRLSRSGFKFMAELSEKRSLVRKTIRKPRAKRV